MKKSLWAIMLSLVLLIGGTLNIFAQNEPDKDFESFLTQFTSSAEFQFSRIKFPLNSPIILLDVDGNEQETPFSADLWPLLEVKDFTIGKYETEDGLFFGRYAIKEKEQVVFEAGMEESELDLIIHFDLVDGKWYVTDCYTGWYGSLPIEDFDPVVYEVQQRNAEFAKNNP